MPCASTAYSKGSDSQPITTPLNAEDEEKDKNSVLNFYRKLINLRNENKELIFGEYKILQDENLSENVFAFSRTLNNNEIIIIVNLSLNDEVLPENLFKNKKILLDTEGDINNNTLLKALEARIYK